MHIVLLIHAASTAMMAGVIWLVQLCHYPLFARVGDAEFAAYHTGHTTRISTLVVPLMLVELASAVALVVLPLPGVSLLERWIGVGLVGAVWLSTFALAVPEHERLAGGFDAEAHRRLVARNWPRTVIWSLRTGLVFSWLG